MIGPYNSLNKIFIPQEDIMISWILKTDPNNSRLIVVSFPGLGALRKFHADTDHPAPPSKVQIFSRFQTLAKINRQENLPKILFCSPKKPVNNIANSSNFSPFFFLQI